MHGLVKNGVASLAQRLGPVHGCIRIPDDLLGPDVLGRPKDNADACADIDGISIHFKGLLEAFEDSLGDTDGLGRIFEVFRQNDKFVTTKPGQGIFFPEAGFDRLGHFSQELVTAYMPEAVVYEFEPVQVQKEDRIMIGTPF